MGGGVFGGLLQASDRYHRAHTKPDRVPERGGGSPATVTRATWHSRTRWGSAACCTPRAGRARLRRSANVGEALCLVEEGGVPGGKAAADLRGANRLPKLLPHHQKVVEPSLRVADPARRVTSVTSCKSLATIYKLYKLRVASDMGRRFGSDCSCAARRRGCSRSRRSRRAAFASGRRCYRQ